MSQPPPPFIFNLEALSALIAEEILINETERKMLGAEDPERMRTEQLMFKLHQQRMVSTKTVLEHFGLPADEKPEE